jgi:serine/threonine protein kinase
MALVKGAKRCYDWLLAKSSGEIVSREEIMSASGWSDVSLGTYFRKNKLAPFLMPLEGNDVKVLLDGKGLSERYFDEVFTQTAPPKISLAVGDKLRGEEGVYTLVEPLGAGAVGQVWSARVDGEPEVRLVAAKIMLPREDLLADSKIVDVRERFRREARNGAMLDHPNIVRYLDLGEVQKNPFLIMERGSSSVGRTLKQSGPMPDEEAAGVIIAVLDALVYLHGTGCPHRDVKPDNIIVFDDSYKLADLGIVKWSDFDPRFTTGGTLTRASMQLGSWFYMAPEQQQDPHEAVESSDVYALGVSWIEMLSGDLPAPHAIGARQYPRPSRDDAVSTIIQRMVSYAPSERPTLAEVRSVVHGLAR